MYDFGGMGKLIFPTAQQSGFGESRIDWAALI
jgi:hypothetical protein